MKKRNNKLYFYRKMTTEGGDMGPFDGWDIDGEMSEEETKARLAMKREELTNKGELKSNLIDMLFSNFAVNITKGLDEKFDDIVYQAVFNLDVDEFIVEKVQSSLSEVDYVFNLNFPSLNNTLIGSSINPWTTGNAIGSIGFFSDTLNKVFPWNGSDEISFHAISMKGIPCQWYGCDFGVEVELIVDNEDSYALNE